MVGLLKSIKRKLPFIWRFIEFLNGILVLALYGRPINKAVIDSFKPAVRLNYQYRQLMLSDLPHLESMITAQSAGFDNFFKPHDFDLKTLKRLYRNPSFLMFGTFDKERIVGYFFLRFFANRTAFRGKMVDSQYQSKGIAKEMGYIMTDIAFRAGFRLFATISKFNYGSMASSAAVNEIHILKELPDNYVYIEYAKIAKC